MAELKVFPTEECSDETRKVTVVLGSVPKDGGTFTFYRNIRPVLAFHGIELKCVSVGPREAALWENSYVDDGCVLLAPKTRSIKKQAREFVEWCERAEVDIVIGLNSEAILSSLPHLPERIRTLSRCANAFDHGYRITMSCATRLARIIAITPRLEQDLVRDYGADSSKMQLIPNGIDPGPFASAATLPRGGESFLRLGFLGRLEHNQKGVFYLPEIVQELKRLGVHFHLKIAGKGKHGERLENQMKADVASGRVEFLGALSHKEVPEFLAETDVFVFTSHFEGCPNALLEGMMAGCVPVSWMIEGITDYIVSDGQTGHICAMGDGQAFAAHIARLARDRESLREMGLAAAEAARRRFTHQTMGEAYAAIIDDVMRKPPPSWAPRAWSEFRRDPNFKHSWKEWIPDSIRRLVKP